MTFGNDTTLLELIHLMALEIESLYELLKQESQVLVDGDVELIESLAASKQSVVARINRLTVQQNDFFGALNLPYGQEGLDAYMGQYMDSDSNMLELKSVWKKITQQLEESQVLNEANGACIELMNRHTERSLEIIRGGPSEEFTYGSNGIKQQTSNTRPVATV